MKRVFIAVDISDETRRRAADYIENLSGRFSRLRVGWERAEKLHLTLKFLGETDEKQLEKLFSVVKKIASEIQSFKLRIANTGVFPSPKKARVLWLDVLDAQGNLAKINAKLEAECEKIGFAREARNFKPHLTIARLRREAHSPGGLVKAHLENEFEPVEFEVSEIAIYESRLQPTGSVYSKLKTFQLRS